MQEIQKYPFRIIIRTNVTKEGILTLDEYMKFMIKHFSRNSHFGFFFRPVGDWGGNRVSSIKDSLLSDLSMVHETLLRYANRIDFSPLLRLLKANLCYAAKANSFVIGPNGDIFKCTVAFDDQINHLGELLPNGTMNIDEKKHALWISQEKTDEKCWNCFAIVKCINGVCPLNRIKNNNVGCGHEIDQIRFTLKLIAEMLEEKGYDLEEGYRI